MFATLVKAFFKTLLYITAAAALWFACALIFPKIKMKAEESKAPKEVTIYVRTNGTHTDIVMPRNINLPNSVVSFNWNNLVNDSLFQDVDSNYRYVAIGWGDKGFYLDTPEWKDLKLSTAFKAVFGLGSTAMHVTYYRHMEAGEHTKAIAISALDYQNLIAEITQGFDLQNGTPQLIAHPSYGTHDNYFEAKGRYSLFKTCNVWTGNTLKKANITMGLWTPLQGGVMGNIP
jgi:uncharacterized protein (TIGR02117 family)